MFFEDLIRGLIFGIEGVVIFLLFLVFIGHQLWVIEKRIQKRKADKAAAAERERLDAEAGPAKVDAGVVSGAAAE